MAKSFPVRQKTFGLNIGSYIAAELLFARCVAPHKNTIRTLTHAKKKGMPRNFSHAGTKSGFLVNFSVANGHAEKYMACRKKYKALISK